MKIFPMKYSCSTLTWLDPKITATRNNLRLVTETSPQEETQSIDNRNNGEGGGDALCGESDEI